MLINQFQSTVYLHNNPPTSRGSSISSEDFSSLASPPESSAAATATEKVKQKTKNMDSRGKQKAKSLLKRRYSVPEIIMRK